MDDSLDSLLTSKPSSSSVIDLLKNGVVGWSGTFLSGMMKILDRVVEVNSPIILSSTGVFLASGVTRLKEANFPLLVLKLCAFLLCAPRDREVGMISSSGFLGCS